jgi:hypothetical protein
VSQQQNLSQDFLKAIMADKPRVVPARKKPLRRPQPPQQSNTPRKRDARVHVLAAWTAWACTKSIKSPPADPDIHAFLAHLRATQPALLSFKGKPRAYEAAFRWIAAR